ncbi:MAG: endonuclease/exonuclease/phosphatase family protein [Nanoarchaeota archaeon]|nr:endonuclease/exonuclease/phosphatase family protein [Nanoarchaeota archaeon]
MKNNQIKILNLNIMHGRNVNNSVFPIFLKKERVAKNIEEIARLIKHENADIVSLQEIDRNSLFTGNFDQLTELMKLTPYRYSFYGKHSSLSLGKKSIYEFGTAILSRYQIKNTYSRPFSFSFPTPRKGFVSAEIEHPYRKIHFASVHMVWLDYLRFHSREKQAKNIIDYFSNYKNTPKIIAGDFNCDFAGKEKTLHMLCDNLNLHTYLPQKKIPTHPAVNPKVRIDWILASKKFKFLNYTVLNDLLSDHLPVKADLLLK